MVTIRRYLDGLVGDAESEKAWLDDKVEGWTDLVEVLVWVTCRHPQIAYYGLKKSLQKECCFFHRITPGIGVAFHPV